MNSGYISGPTEMACQGVYAGYIITLSVWQDFGLVFRKL